MLSRKWKNWLYVGLGWVFYGATVLGLLVGGSMKASPDAVRDVFPALADFLGHIQSAAWWLSPSLFVIAGVANAWRNLIGPPSVWDTIHFLLGEIRKSVFAGYGGGPHHHRVTLFKHVWFWWSIKHLPWTGWLVAVERSGDIEPRVVFLAPSRDPDRAEGVAGKTWATDKTVQKANLPNLVPESSEDAQRLYAEKTEVGLEWVARRLGRKKRVPRAITGIPIEVKGKRWGVLVFDSTEPGQIKYGNALNDITLKALSKLLEGR